MPQVTQKVLVDDNTDGTKAPVNIRSLTAYAVFVKAVGGTSATIKFQGTADPQGLLGFTDLLFRETPTAAYAAAAVVVVPATARSFYFDPSDNVCWIRAVVASQTGPTTLTATVTGEH